MKGTGSRDRPRKVFLSHRPCACLQVKHSYCSALFGGIALLAINFTSPSIPSHSCTNQLHESGQRYVQLSLERRPGVLLRITTRCLFTESWIRYLFDGTQQKPGAIGDCGGCVKFLLEPNPGSSALAAVIACPCETKKPNQCHNGSAMRAFTIRRGRAGHAISRGGAVIEGLQRVHVVRDPRGGNSALIGSTTTSETDGLQL